MTTMVKNAAASWKTSTLGIMAFAMIAINAATAVLDNDPSTIADWNLVVEGFLVMMALFLARDGDKSSEAVGAK